MANFVLTTLRDAFFGSPAEDNFFFLTPDTLQSTDTIVGAAGPFIDIAVATAPGSIAATQFSGASGELAPVSLDTTLSTRTEKEWPS